MEFLGVGPLELIFIVLIAIVLLGPSDMLKAARTVGRVLRTVFTSEGWREMQRSMNTLRNLPTSMMREAGLEDDLRTISQATQLNVPAIEIPKSALSAPTMPGEKPPPDQETQPPVLIQTPPFSPDASPREDLPRPSKPGGESVPPDIKNDA
jgi:Sec-independent protein translocase protein TatA